jgi:GNAT superfamily N-acetyltransferase
VEAVSQAFSLEQVICRPAVEGDLADIRAFCRTIWDGHDYVPDAVEDWLHDPQGMFAVAEYEGHAIACSKITRLAEGQWWLEGFRVDPGYQGRKVGSLIHRYIDGWWVGHGDGVLRLMTSSKNKSVQHLCESTGYIKRFEVRGYKAGPLEGHAGMFRSAVSAEMDLPAVIEFARRSPSLAITDRLVDFGWEVVDPTEGKALSFLFSQASDFANHFLWWRDEKGLLIVWDDLDEEENGQALGIGVLASELGDLPAFLLDVRRLAAAQKKASVFWLAPAQETVTRALEQAGYSSDWDNTAFVFEKRHPRRSEESESRS